MKEFMKTTIVGGVLFLLRLGLVLFILGYALRLATRVVQPIAKALHLDGAEGGRDRPRKRAYSPATRAPPVVQRGPGAQPLAGA